VLDIRSEYKYYSPMFSSVNLRDPIWTGIGVFVAVLLALIGTGTTAFFYYLQKKRKSLSCQLLADAELFSHRNIDGKFKITYENHPVRNASLIFIKVINDGDVPIKAADFVEDLTISFGPGTRVLEVAVVHNTDLVRSRSREHQYKIKNNRGTPGKIFYLIHPIC
jgi:hypothetical protein